MECNNQTSSRLRILEFLLRVLECILVNISTENVKYTECLVRIIVELVMDVENK